MKRRDFIFGGAAASLCAGPAIGLETSAGRLVINQVVAGLNTPWAFQFLPDGSIVITERDGALRIWTTAGLADVSGVGDVVARGQGGLLDVLVPRDFARTRHLFFTYSKRQNLGSGTAVARARLSSDGSRLETWEDIFEIRRGSSGGRHFGSRLVEAQDGTLFVTIGDRGDRRSAQDRANENGTVLRITKTGAVPADNPFTKTSGVQPAIWSWGHRNAQGAALDTEGNLWVIEHGAKGGDELNRVRKGANYGWPVISYGRHYTGLKIGEGTEKEGLEQPVYYWDPSIAPSGLLFYSGSMFPDWAGSAFSGSLKMDYIARLSGGPFREVEQIRIPGASRFRDIRQGPDGSIWVLSVGDGALYRLSS
ncbi:MAG: PQQ-dependent sugar dehydrogenase [Pseudomonadota bacterium]